MLYASLYQFAGYCFQSLSLKGFDGFFELSLFIVAIGSLINFGADEGFDGIGIQFDRDDAEFYGQATVLF